MTVFGVQLILTMIVASFLHKLSPYYSLGRWLLTWRLQRYLPPSDKLLRPHLSTAPNSAASKLSKKKAMSQHGKVLSSPDEHSIDEVLAAINYDPNALDPSLAVPKSANIKLATAPLKWKEDVEKLHFTGELEFALNLTAAALAVFCLTAIYYRLLPLTGATGGAAEYNMSTVWLLVASGYIFKVLFSLTQIYLSEELAHQRSLVIIFTTLLFVCALGVLLVDESVLDFGLDRSHRNISDSISTLLESLLKNGRSLDLVPMWSFKIVLAISCSFLSMVLVFPGFRFADTHFNTVYHNRGSPLFKTLLHANYIAPMCCLSLWIRPLTRDVIATGSVGDRASVTVNLLGVVEVSYEAFRAWALLGVCALRLALFRTYLQSYLDTAKWKVENMRREQGRIPISQLRKKVSNIFLFYSALAVQYIGPYVILFCATLLLHASISSQATPLNAGGPTSPPPPPAGGESSVNMFRLSGFGLGSFEGCFAFVCWWICFTNTITSGFGAILKECI